MPRTKKTRINFQKPFSIIVLQQIKTANITYEAFTEGKVTETTVYHNSEAKLITVQNKPPKAGKKKFQRMKNSIGFGFWLQEKKLLVLCDSRHVLEPWI